MTDFAGFTQEAFDAYTEEKWSSNVHNLKRMRIKDSMVALCEKARTSLAEELEGLARGASDEIPNIMNQKKVDAQWVYWFRDAEARKELASFLEKTPLNQAQIFHIAPHEKHVVLSVVLRQDHLWVGICIAEGAVVDRRNLAAKLARSWERETILEWLKELPEGAEMGFADALQPTADVTLDMLESWSEALGSSGETWKLGHRIALDEALELGPDLADHVGRWMGALLPFFRFISWTRENDHIDATKQIQEQKQQERRQGTSYTPGDKVRIISGLFTGKLGVVQDIESKSQVKVSIGKISVVIPGNELKPTS